MVTIHIIVDMRSVDTIRMAVFMIFIIAVSGVFDDDMGRFDKIIIT